MVGEPGDPGTRNQEGVVMDKERSRIRRRLGPIGMSLLASALTAAGFAAFSIADSGGGNNDGNQSEAVQTLPAPAPGGAGGAIAFAPRLSAEDRQPERPPPTRVTTRIRAETRTRATRVRRSRAGPARSPHTNGVSYWRPI